VATTGSAYIEAPKPTDAPVKTLGDFLSASGAWHAKTAQEPGDVE